jgi:hypothetical protein
MPKNDPLTYDVALEKIITAEELAIEDAFNRWFDDNCASEAMEDMDIEEIARLSFVAGYRKGLDR